MRSAMKADVRPVSSGACGARGAACSGGFGAQTFSAVAVAITPPQTLKIAGRDESRWTGRAGASTRKRDSTPDLPEGPQPRQDLRGSLDARAQVALPWKDQKLAVAELDGALDLLLGGVDVVD